MTVSASAASVVPVGNVTTPYAETAPTFDGVISEGEWTGDKVTITGANFQVNYDAGKDTTTNAADANLPLSVNLYAMWDETNLYLCFDVTDPTYVPYVAGQDADAGDFMLLFMDPNGAFEASGMAPNLCTVLSHIIPLAPEKNGDYSGAAYWYETAYDTKVANWDVSTGCDKAGSKKTANGYTLEIAFPWANLLYAANAIIGSAPAIQVGSTCKLALDYWNYDQYGGASYRICSTEKDYYLSGQTKVWWFGNCNNGINLQLTEAVKTEAPETADTLSFGILLGAVALAGTALVMGKKR